MEIQSTQVCISLNPLFSRHKGIRVQFTDEPTGNLDEGTAAEIIRILKSSAKASGKCVVVVTHARELADQADVVYQLTHERL